MLIISIVRTFICFILGLDTLRFKKLERFVLWILIKFGYSKCFS